MGVEIERKFLVTGNVWEQYTNVKIQHIQQGYISKSKKHTVRIRIVADTEAYITIKGPRIGCTGSEFEYQIPYDDGIQMLKMCDAGLIEKTRYVFKDAYNQLWEVDKFAGNNDGLIVAEIELPSEDTLVILPDWITLECTFDKRYTNSRLSSHSLIT
jgi:CYTH domain-containing protein